MRSCSICYREFSRLGNLRRHMKTKHPSAGPIPLERQREFGKSRKEIDQNDQYGAGYRKNSSYDGEDDDDDDDDDNDVDDDDVVDEESEEEEDDDHGEDDEKEENQEDNQHSTFEKFLDNIDREAEKGTLTMKQRVKLLMKKYGEFLVWWYEHRKNPTHKKIIETYKELVEGPLEYDREEALLTAVKQRPILFKRIVEDLYENDTDMKDNAAADDDDDDDDDHDDDDVQMMT